MSSVLIPVAEKWTGNLKQIFTLDKIVHVILESVCKQAASSEVPNLLKQTVPVS